VVARIPKGMRAFTIEVNEQTGVSGFVLPDHRVDVVQIESGPNGQVDAEAVLQDVLVIASGQTFTRPDDRSIQVKTVTLAVTPGQVDILVAAKSHGALTLSLRGLNDHVQSPLKKKEKKETPPPPEPKAEIVAVKTPEPAPEPAPVPPPAPPPPAPPPARFISLYRGLDNMRRIRIDLPPDMSPDELAALNATPATTPAPASTSQN
jgi:pilus assembly protein CpaB